MKLVIDIETQNSFKDIGGKTNLGALKVSLVGAYLYGEDKFLTFMEDEMEKLGELIKKAELVIGYNLKGFDYPVLQSYLKHINFNSIKTLDIMEKAQQYLGYKIKLDAIAHASLGLGKIGTGLGAIEYWEQGKIDELKKYCLKDVEITRDVYEYGAKNKMVKFKSMWGTYEIPAEWY